MKNLNTVKIEETNATTKSVKSTATTATTPEQLLAVQTKVIAQFPAALNEQTFDCYGTSILNNATKVRFANYINKRIKVLVKNEHTDIQLVNTQNSVRVTKLQACAIMLQSSAYSNTAQYNAVVKYVVNNCAQHLQALAVTQAQIATAIA